MLKSKLLERLDAERKCYRALVNSMERHEDIDHLEWLEDITDEVKESDDLTTLAPVTTERIIAMLESDYDCHLGYLNSMLTRHTRRQHAKAIADTLDMMNAIDPVERWYRTRDGQVEEYEDASVFNTEPKWTWD